MKKVLVLMLVLGMASMATAGLSLWVDGAPAESTSIILATSDTVMIGLYNDGTVDKSIGYLTIDGGPGSWTGAYAIYNPPASGSASTYAYLYPYPSVLNGWIFLNADAVLENVNGIGVLGEFEFHCDGIGDVTISYNDSALGLMDTLVIHQIPEPVTMALLGLGGLFPRRRK